MPRQPSRASHLPERRTTEAEGAVSYGSHFHGLPVIQLITIRSLRCTLSWLLTAFVIPRPHNQRVLASVWNLPVEGPRQPTIFHGDSLQRRGLPSCAAVYANLHFRDTILTGPSHTAQNEAALHQDGSIL